jgi:hypothetical protein
MTSRGQRTGRRNADFGMGNGKKACRGGRMEGRKGNGEGIERVVDRVANIFNLKPEHVLSSVKQPQRVMARSLLCYWVVKKLQMSGSEVARRLPSNKSAVNLSVMRGEKIATDMNLKLIVN